MLATHLHFDHAGGFTERAADGSVRPRFPRAQYVVRRGEWDDAMHPNERTKGSYFLENYKPLADHNVLQLVDEDVDDHARRARAAHRRAYDAPSDGDDRIGRQDRGLCRPTCCRRPRIFPKSGSWATICSRSIRSTSSEPSCEKPSSASTSIVFEHDPDIAAGYIREKRREAVHRAGR